MKKNAIEQFSLNFDEQKEKPAKTENGNQISDVETSAGKVRIINEPTRTVWEGLAPRDEADEIYSRKKSVKK